MEKFYIVTDESSLRKDYFDWVENFEIIRKKVIEFKKANGITSKEYHASSDLLYIVPTEADLKQFGKVLNKDIGNGLRPFKKGSRINKQWVNTLQREHLKVLSKPMVGFEFCAYGKFSTRLFDYKDTLYCSMNGANDFETPKGFTEIKASEFYKVVEEVQG